LFATHVRGRSRTRLLSLALVGGIALSATAASTEALVAMSPAASSASMARPNVAAAPATTSATTSTDVTAVVQAQLASAGPQQIAMVPFVAFFSAWAAVPGHSSYTMHDFSGDAYATYFGQCTWYAWYRHQRQPLMRLGNAGAWPARAWRFGLRVSSRPVVGATVVFAPGVQGASALGHAGVVERVLGGGWLMISEMNFYWNGGGWGRVDYRYIHVGRGVRFIF